MNLPSAIYDLCRNLLDAITAFFGVSKQIESHNTTITSRFQKWDRFNLCENNVKTSEMYVRFYSW